MTTPAEQLEQRLKQLKITEVECLVTDLTGIARGKISPTNKFLGEGGMRLPESVLLQTVTGDFVDDDIYYDLLDEADIDMVCRPDPDAIFLVPWAIEPTAMVFHDTFDRVGRPIELSPRNVLKRVLKLYADKGWSPVVAPEMEFYLTKRSSDPDFPLVAPVGRSGRPESGRQSFSIDATNEFDPLFEDVYDWCEIQGLDLDTLIHEDGPAQMEINFRHGNAQNLKQAHAFIDYLLRPEVIARVTNQIGYPNPNPASTALIAPELLNEKNLFVPEEDSHQLFQVEPPHRQVLRLMTRLWNRVRSDV